VIFRDPHVDPQLQSGSATEGADCAVQTTRGAARWATDGEVIPTVRQVRSAAGKALGGLDVLDVRTALQSFGVSARVTNSLDECRAALDAGYAVIAAVNYRYLNANYPQLSGDRNFIGTSAKPALHSILLFGPEKVLQGDPKRGPLWLQDHDPLHDARRAVVPKSNVNARWRWITECMTAMPSGVQAVIVQPTW
jgi:hypothetical protein